MDRARPSKFHVDFFYSSQTSDKVTSGTNEVANSSGLSTSFIQQTLHFRYKLQPQLALNVTVPRIEIHREEKGKNDVNLEGLGDIATFLQWKPWVQEARETGRFMGFEGFSLIAGLEWPAGKSSENPEISALAPSLLQTGSGTYDPILGIAYETRIRSWTFFHQTMFQFAVGESRGGLKPGEVIELSSGLGYRLFGRALPNASFDAVFLGQDELDGVPIANTGASLLFVTPGLSIQLARNLTLDGGVRVPVYRKVVRAQLVPGRRWRIGLTYRW